MDTGPSELLEYRWREKRGSVAVVDDAEVHYYSGAYMVSIPILFSGRCSSEGFSPYIYFPVGEGSISGVSVKVVHTRIWSIMGESLN